MVSEVGLKGARALIGQSQGTGVGRRSPPGNAGGLLRDLSLDGFGEQGREGPKAEIGVLGVLRGFEDHLPLRRISREAESTLWVV